MYGRVHPPLPTRDLFLSIHFLHQLAVPRRSPKAPLISFAFMGFLENPAESFRILENPLRGLFGFILGGFGLAMLFTIAADYLAGVCLLKPRAHPPGRYLPRPSGT